MRYAQIRKMDITNGEGVGVALFTQGCPYHCKNCFNPETWDFDSGVEWTKDTEKMLLELLKPDYITRLTILGGEPLIERNITPLVALLKQVKGVYPNKQVWLYTGGNYEILVGIYKEVFQYIDILIDGQYVDDLKDYTLKFRGSSNQRIIDVQESLSSGEVKVRKED